MSYEDTEKLENLKQKHKLELMDKQKELIRLEHKTKMERLDKQIAIVKCGGYSEI